MSKIKYCWNCGKEVPYQIYKNINFIPKCPCCGVEYPEKPKDEALLSIYQEEYLKDKSEKNFNRLFDLLSKTTFNVICHKLKIKSSYEQLDDVWDKVQWTLEKLTKYYKEKPNFKVTTSFVQYIGQLVLYPLYNKDEQERHKNEISIHTPIFGNTDKSTKELSDYLSQSNDGNISNVESGIDYEYNQNRLVKNSLSFFEKAIESLYDYEKNKGKNKEFKKAYYMLLLCKFFIFNETEDKVVCEILNSLDFNLIKKFDEIKNEYKNQLLKFVSDNYD